MPNLPNSKLSQIYTVRCVRYDVRGVKVHVLRFLDGAGSEVRKFCTHQNVLHKRVGRYVKTTTSSSWNIMN